MSETSNRIEAAMQFKAGMVLDNIPEVSGLKDLNGEDLRRIMLTRDSHAQHGSIESTIRNLFVWAVVEKAEDIHIEGRGERDDPEIYVHVRLPSGFVNFRFVYQKKEGRHWENKIFSLTGTAQGASTLDIVSTRFDMQFPTEFAVGHGLRPFDGANSYDIDVRVEYTKLYNGFGVIARLLDSQRARKLHDLGLTYVLLRCIERIILEPSGLILVTGPTGSGKTTLLNAILALLNDGSRAIDTIEDPVEIALRGHGPIKQRQIGGAITHERALRSQLRSGPDVILIGEIRDSKTMEIALQAAQTGHLVLATLHTNDAAESYTRALDLTADKGRDAYRLAQVLKLVVAQRLLPRQAPRSQKRRLDRDELDWLAANGIDHPHELDEAIAEKEIGKVTIIEAIVTTPAVKKQLMSERVNTTEIYKAACDQHQYEPLAVGGLRAVQARSATLRDCIVRLEGNTEAKAHPSLRVRLAKEYGLNFVEVADGIDRYHRERDQGGDTPLTFHLQAVKDQKRSTFSEGAAT